jgi:hypothetical protein
MVGPLVAIKRKVYEMRNTTTRTFRCDEITDQQLHELTIRLDMSASDVARLAVRKLYAEHFTTNFGVHQSLRTNRSEGENESGERDEHDVGSHSHRRAQVD